jgi:CO/xanthine dehydrogenase Mo-binding subunit
MLWKDRSSVWRTWKPNFAANASSASRSLSSRGAVFGGSALIDSAEEVSDDAIRRFLHFEQH